ELANKDKKKNQTAVAKEIGITKQMLTNWKSGYSEPNIDDLILLASYFNTSIDYLVGYENEDGTKSYNIANSFNQNKGNINFKG
ncbi:MAG: helix-turn-helix domain-containing protein, partial [Clostridiales bacterium]|nr:helix-turn-helix domain-containing protein [Clostridiales bacterium]